MRHLILIGAMCAGLTACATPQQIADRDDKECRAKGNEAGSVGYIDCRAAIEKQRMDARTQDQPLKLPSIPGTPGAAMDGGA